MANTHPNAHPSAGSYTNAYQVAAELAGMGPRAQAKSVVVVRHYAMLLETRIKANASGRPGPNVITGDYRRSWTHHVTVRPDRVEGVVGTNKPQGRRLEFGFVGADRTGAVFNQPPYPHVGPAYEQTAPEMEQAMRGVIES